MNMRGKNHVIEAEKKTKPEFGERYKKAAKIIRKQQHTSNSTGDSNDKKSNNRPGELIIYKDYTNVPSKTPSNCPKVIIRNLTSERGDYLNGCIGHHCEGRDGRDKVWVNGYPEIFSLRSSKLKLIDAKCQHVVISVTRKTIRDECYTVTVAHDDRRNIVLDNFTVPAEGLPKTRGTLMALKTLFKNLNESSLVRVSISDLNLVQGLNRGRLGQDIRFPALQDIFDRVLKLYQSLPFIVIDFHMTKPLMPDYPGWPSAKRPGENRIDSVAEATYHIFACPNKSQYDMIEVMYAANNKLFHEWFYDYGPDEAGVYVEHAVSMGEEHRLDPSVLAQVDPSAFWSCILHIDQIIRDLPLRLLKTTWADTLSGSLKRRKIFAGLPSVTDHLLPRNGRWQIQSGRRQELSGIENASLGVIVCLREMAANKNIDGTTIKMAVPEYYKRTQFGTMYNAVCGTSNRNEGNGYMETMISATKPPLDVCLECGKEEDLKPCSGCKTVAFCSTSCRKAACKVHNSRCRFLRKINKCSS